MTQRLNIHQPRPAADIESVDGQRMYDLLQAQTNIREIFDEIADKEHLDSFLIEDVSLTTAAGTNNVAHKLGRAIRGWHIVKKNANADIWQDPESTVDQTLFLPLKVDADVTVSIVLF